MYHSITFTNENGISKNTWDDWHLIPSERPSVAYPIPKTNISQVARVHGSAYDTTDISGHLSYGVTEGSWSFIVSDQSVNWAELYSELLNFLHGQAMTVVLEDDLYHYHKGRMKVAWQTGASYSSVTVSYSINKYLHDIGV